MSRKQIVVYVLVSLVVIAALAVGGYALYRLGYSHGLQDVSQLPFEKRLIPDFHRRIMPDLPNFRWYIRSPLLMSLPGLLSALGIIALVVLAVIGLVKILQPNQGVKVPLPEERASPAIAADKNSPSA